jgi:hypothetical protein
MVKILSREILDEVSDIQFGFLYYYSDATKTQSYDKNLIILSPLCVIDIIWL